MPAEQAVHTSESAEPLRAEPATQTHVAAVAPLLESAGQAVQLVEAARLYVFAKQAGAITRPPKRGSMGRREGCKVQLRSCRPEKKRS